MITISLCMIVRNEEQMLGRCLSTVADAVDEIIVVDTGSTDGTLAVATQYTDHIFHFEWIDDFSAARNESFRHATKDYILWLDADDWLDERELYKLKSLKEQLDPAVDAVIMDYWLDFDPLGQPTAVVKRHRLLKRSRKFQWHDAVHEQLAVQGYVVLTDIAICHGREQTNGERNLRIYEAMLAKGVQLSSRQRMQYAMELTANGRHEQAIANLETVLADPTGYYEMKLECCGRMAHCYHELGLKEQELRALIAAFKYDIPRADYVCRIGYFYQENNNYEKAVYWYQLALKLEKPEGRLYGMNHSAWTWLPHLQLVYCYGKLGQLALAYEHNEIALTYSPNDSNLLHNKKLLEKYVSNNERDETLK
ncbi:glycosyltransferase family 2 protein [Paenibacillus harenae]|uniref:Glycosyltransferase involved in cell wall biosynthesis n=1 Tax=Paenibacillus harenae TaxID=306543 RepID=A0ABT9UDE9_PAEHA|nr:glycosyltransferase [Paenibacillus harenae]MDQ0116244.1 glycosyltransferase involved in cell wall biosynthesis [Paenibacillus harenae]